MTPRHDHFAEAAAARAATLAPSDAGAAKLGRPGQAARPRTDRAARRRRHLRRGRPARQRPRRRPSGFAVGAGLPADGVVTGRGLVDGRPAVVIANDPTVKAGSWGARTVEKIVRATETALREELPVFWLVDSAGARITDQVELFPGRRGAGRIFHNQVALSGKVPQICCLFGPSAAGGAYIPAFCDIVVMVEGNASHVPGQPADGRDGRRARRSPSRRWAVPGCTAPSPAAATTSPSTTRTRIEQARLFFSYLPTCWREAPPEYPAEPPVSTLTRELGARPGVRALRRPRRHRRARRRRLVLRGQAAVRRRARRRVRPARRAAGRRSSPTTARSRAASSSATPRTRPPGSSGSATPSTCRCCTSPTCPGS